MTLFLTGLVLISGCLATIVAAMLVGGKPGVYYSKVSVLFQAPVSARFPNRYISGGGSLIATAGIVRQLVERGADDVPVVSDAVTLPSEGIRHGFSVVLPNDGGQWAVNYDKAQLDVQAVGSSSQEVLATMNRVIARIASALAALQNAADAPANDRITVQNSPPRVPTYYLQGSRKRAMAAVLVLGLGATAALATAVRRGLPAVRAA